MSLEEKIDAAKLAIARVHDDQSVPLSRTREALEELEQEACMWREAVETDMRREEYES